MEVCLQCQQIFSNEQVIHKVHEGNLFQEIMTYCDECSEIRDTAHEIIDRVEDLLREEYPEIEKVAKTVNEPSNTLFYGEIYDNAEADIIRFVKDFITDT